MSEEHWAGKKVLVTGADGFIGSHLVEALLHRRARVLAFTRGTSTHGTGQWTWHNLGAVVGQLERVITGNVAQAETTHIIQDLAPDVIFHLAAEAYVARSFERPGEVFATNATGTLHVLEAARRLPRLQRVVITSSCEVYGPALDNQPISEDYALNPTSPYAASKVAADRLASSYHVTFGVPTAIIRPFNTFGPRHTYDVIPQFIKRALAGEELTVHGRGEQRRDFVYVEDTVAAFLLMGEHPRAVGEVVNFGTGQAYSIRHTAERIVALCGGRSQIVHDMTRLAGVQCRLCDATKARRLLGWQPKIEFEEGLRRNIAAERAKKC
jgi:NDP-hexose 4,6-dehydratase